MSQKPGIVLASLQGPPQPWSLGPTISIPDLCSLLTTLSGNPEAVLLWNSQLGPPSEQLCVQLLKKSGDLWHAGLSLGTSGAPYTLDTTRPAWMLGVDPPSDIECTSWRAHPHCSLIRTALIRALDGFDSEFLSAEGAMLDFGLRAIRAGALCRHIPHLVGGHSAHERFELPLEDAFRIVSKDQGVKWLGWALAAAIGQISPSKALRLWGRLKSVPRSSVTYQPHTHQVTPDYRPEVAVIIPTLNRPRQLERLLPQLDAQTIRPTEVHVVDQTPEEDRDQQWLSSAGDLPLIVHNPSKRGQCSSRNLALRESNAEAFLFIDDDDDAVPRELLAGHLKTLSRFQAGVSSGVALEPGERKPGADFDRTRVSDVFPTNNTLATRKTLIESGLFDLAYEQGARADHDLGFRAYLSGALMVLNPELSLVHDRAPQGGLRTWGARKKTYKGSREHLFEFHLPSITELYLSHRYLSRRKRRWLKWIAVLGTMSIRGSLSRKAVRVILAGLALPVTFLRMAVRNRQAKTMLQHYPQIARFN